MISSDLRLARAGHSGPVIRSPFRLIPAVLIGFAALFVLATTAQGLLLHGLILLVLVAVVWAAWRWPVGAAITLIVLVPINRFLIFLLFSATGSSFVMHSAQLWKDLLIFILLARVIHEALLRRKAPRLYYLDLLVLMYLGLSAIYIFYPGTLPDNSLIGRIFGFRIDAYFLLAYFVGRGLPLKRHHIKWIVVALIPGSVAVGIVAGLEWFIPDLMVSFYDRLGFSAFVDAVGASKTVPIKYRDLGGAELPRASSLVGGELDLAFYQLLVVPFSAVLFFFARRPLAQWSAGIFFFLMVATLIMTVTRSALVAAPVALVILAIFSGAYSKTLIATIAVVVLGSAFLLSAGVSGESVSFLLSPDEGSAVAHVDAINESLQIVREEPLGRGLGTAFAVAFQFRLASGITNESWYLQLATEMGIAAAVLFGVIIVLATASAFAAFGRVKDYWLRVLTLGVGGAGVGLILVGGVLHVFQSPMLTALFWLLAGAAVSAANLERGWDPSPARISADETGNLP